MLVIDGYSFLLQLHRPESTLGGLSRCSQSAASHSKSKAMRSCVHRQELFYSRDVSALSLTALHFWDKKENVFLCKQVSTTIHA